VAAAAVAAGCGNLYYRDWPPSYRHETVQLGEVRQEVDARAVGMAGAGRASVYGAESVISNPAALAALDGGAVSAGGGYRHWNYTVQPDQAGLKAQSFFGSFAGAYGAGAWPVVPGRFAVGGALWAPHDYTYEIGGEGEGGEIKSRGALRAAGPAAAVRFGGLSCGVGADYIWGGERITSSEPGFEEVDLRGRGYDVRLAFGSQFDLAPGWALAAMAVGKKGADVRFTGDRSYKVQFPPTAGAAVSVSALSVNVHLDYLFTFYEAMEADDAEVAETLAATAYNAGWGAAGAEYVLDSGAVARAGFGYRPWYIRDGMRRRVDWFHYAMGGGWPILERHGRLDVGLGYGRRGALDTNGYSTDVIEVQATVDYFW
jgi:hypothetical protein